MCHSPCLPPFCKYIFEPQALARPLDPQRYDLTVQPLIRYNPSRILVVEPVEARRQAALAFGATSVAATLSELEVEAEWQGAERVYEATNSSDGIKHTAMVARRGGHGVIIGIPDGNIYNPMPADLLRRKALTLKTSRRMGKVMPQAIELVHSGEVDVESMVTARFPLAAAAEAFATQAALKNGAIKTIIDVSARQ